MRENLLTIERERGWEYRRLFVSPDRRIWQWHRLGPCDRGFLDDVVATLDDLTQQEGNGWHVIATRAAEDDRGRCWLDVMLKRRESAGRQVEADRSRSASGVLRAAELSRAIRAA